ncbi:hypothetical protein BU23DRAFT_573502 [Bimuria novae-zelandiae CBS 107.79]|uniref:Fungal N-terminal domain-containing protein n=1 Tax=Bimuria novae-zelandiae CBS 107.79 TaxID=1447943 RepID=A0A6A5V1D0_9PLEO|nr:hypothetical protein BU23DRAFT_573502 [Bimuria novae-zelandiae CBS 107.79]
MADPLSITASVVTLIQVSIQVTLLLRGFRDDVSLADATLIGLSKDVEGFQHVVKAIKDTLDHDEVKATLQATGHVGNHWKNLARSLDDSADKLKRLQELLDDANKGRSFLKGTRKALRLRGIKEQIAGYREQVNSYRGALQLSLSTILLWNQITLQKSTDSIPERILPSLDGLYEEFGKFGTMLNAKIEPLQVNLAHRSQQPLDSAPGSGHRKPSILVQDEVRDPFLNLESTENTQQQLQSIQNLRDCIRSAAEVASSATTTLTVEANDAVSVYHGSNVAEIFKNGQNATVKKLVQSHTMEETDVASSELRQGHGTAFAPVVDDPDSESDIESDVARALLSDAKERLRNEDWSGAARLLRNCLSRLSSSNTVRPLAASTASQKISREEVLGLLVLSYIRLKAWPDARAAMLEKMKMTEQRLGAKDLQYLSASVAYAGILHECYECYEYIEAHLQARSALRGLKRLGVSGQQDYGRCLELLVTISYVQWSIEDADGYTALLSSHRLKTDYSDMACEGSAQRQLRLLKMLGLANMEETTGVPDSDLITAVQLDAKNEETADSTGGKSEDADGEKYKVDEYGRLHDEAGKTSVPLRAISLLISSTSAPIEPRHDLGNNDESFKYASIPANGQGNRHWSMNSQSHVEKYEPGFPCPPKPDSIAHMSEHP